MAHLTDHLLSLWQARTTKIHSSPWAHLDSVATGGRFDGPLGVIGGLKAFKSMKEQGIKTYEPIALINLTNEEGARFCPPLGSSVVYAGEKVRS